MFRLSLKNVLARKGRLTLTALAIIAGTAFLSGVFVFSDTISGAFDKIFASAFANTDAYVRSTNKVEANFNTTRDQIPDSLIATVQAVPGVASASGDIQGYAQMSTSDGKEMGGGGPPTFGAAYTGAPTSPWTIADGRAPSGSTEVVIDRGTAKRYDVAVGDEISITTQVGTQQFTVVGDVRFAGEDSTGGTSWALFDLPTAQSFVLGKTGVVDAIDVGGDGTLSQQELADRIQQALVDAGNQNVETLTGKQITAENKSEIEKSLSFLTLFLSIFALIAIFVGSFIIFNVFSISAAQRQQENALLRAIGASRGQVTRSLLVEAVVVGVAGSLLGYLGGVALAKAIFVLLSAFGLDFASSSLQIEPGGFVVTMLVGVLVTLLCAIVPAIRSGRIPPLAAMRDVSVDRAGISRKRIVVGVAFLAIAAVGIAAGLGGTTELLGVGVVGLFVALIALGPLVAGPTATLATPILRSIGGVLGAIAGRNAARNPKRIALTAGALGVGLSLLVGVATLGASAKQSVRDQVGAQFLGDFTIAPSAAGSGFGGLPQGLADQVAQLPEVRAAAGLGATAVNLAEPGDEQANGKLVAVVDPTQAEGTLGLEFSAGSWADLTADSIIVSKEHADEQGLAVGDTIVVTLLDGTSKELAVGAIFDSKIFGAYILDRSTFDGSSNPVFDSLVVITAEPGEQAAAEAAIEPIVEQYPTAELQTRDEYIDSQSDQVDSFLNFIYGLLGMSIFIAILGIVITMLLSVYERRRELGLMRAVGTTRGQVAGSTVWESVLVALIGAMMGVVLGLVLGWVVVKALRDEGLTSFALPVSSIVVFAALAIFLAVVFALIPAWRASRADILSAIATT
ncbi:MAG: FtsX-like permease family protein [Ilumatobacteraceae bacterium]